MLSETYENYRHEELTHTRGQKMEFDIFLPYERLAFEYQGEHHYYDVYLLGNSWQQKDRDQQKREACMEHGITFIEIPYWWDGQLPSLEATVRQQWKNLSSCFPQGTAIPPQSLINSPTRII
jgi:hypothetical protein